ncbi:MAG: hypothetical protein EOO24_47435, partial [Comamonadaceae bacterium]
MAANIQAALEALSTIGAGNVLVTADAATPGAAVANFSLTFRGALAGVDVSDFRTNFSGLVNATARPFEVTKGAAAVAEQQQVTITTSAREASFTLSLVHRGVTYTTGAISIGATLAQAQAAIDAAFANLAGADVDVLSFTGKRMTVRFSGSLAGVDVATMTVAATAQGGSAVLQSVRTGSTTQTAAVGAHAVVVDFTETDLKVSTGTGPKFAFTLDGSRGAMMEASGTLDIDVFGFVQVKGNFAITKDTRQVKLADAAGTSVTVDALTFGASNASAFAGVDGGTSQAMGFAITDGDFALALLSDQANPANTWTALKADVASAGMVGFNDFLTLSAQDIGVEINRVGKQGGPVIDFGALPITITTGGGESVQLTIDGDRGAYTAVSIGRATLAISDYIYISGGFYFEQTDGETVDVVTGLNGSSPLAVRRSLD